MEQSRYLGNFHNSEDIAREFRIPYSEIQKYEILFAWYDYANYEGSAYVLLGKNGFLYETSGNHCSCVGLEGQWEPEKTSIEAIMIRDWDYLEECFGFPFEELKRSLNWYDYLEKLRGQEDNNALQKGEQGM